MASKKQPGKHNRQERLKKIAEQIENGELVDYEEDGSAEDTGASPEPFEGAMANGSAMPEAPLQDEALDDNAFDGVDNMAGFDVDAAGYPLEGAPAEDGAFVMSNFSEIPKQRKRRALKAFGITAGVLIACALVAYIAGAVVFMSRFLPNTFIGDQDISMKTDEEVMDLLDGEIAAYKLDVVGNNFSYQATSSDVGMSIDSKSIVAAMHNDLDSWKWPLLIVESNHDESRHLVATFNRDDCEKAIAKKVKEFNKDAKAPVNATIVFNEKTNKFDIKAEEEGTQLDSEIVQESIIKAISELQPSLTLTSDHLKKPTVYSTDEKLNESAKLASGLVSARVILTLDGSDVKEINGEDLSKFVEINKKLDVNFKEDEMREWVAELAAGFDTIGTQRNYTRSDGKEISVKGGVYGWEIDTDATNEAILEAIKEGKAAEIDIPCISTAATYSGPNERDWGNRYIDVDLSEQHVRFYGDNGSIIWEADCISGVPDGKKNTWEGVWVINSKESPSTLIGYLEDGKTKEYEEKVQYWMPFEGNGIGFHDAAWQPGFGGTMYRDGYGSHGCINLSTKDAESLYKMVSVGDVVVVHQ